MAMAVAVAVAAQAMAQFRFCPYNYNHHYHSTPSPSLSFQSPRHCRLQTCFSFSGGDGIGGGSGGRGRGDSDSNWNWNSNWNSESDSVGFGIVGIVVNGWRSRVAADPQFPFKVMMEELVGVSGAVAGDMATRPNLGVNELDFVFSTLVVGSILNLVLMYLLAPTLSSSSTTLPSIFATCPSGHMFEPGPYGIIERLGTLVYKGGVFAMVGLGAGLVGTGISNGLIAVRKRVDPTFERPNKAPPTVLNALTWGGHMGVSSNVRYQILNGIEFVLEKVVPPLVFKSSVLVLRLVNNVLGGVTFVMLARFTGSQTVANQSSTHR